AADDQVVPLLRRCAAVLEAESHKELQRLVQVAARQDRYCMLVHGARGYTGEGPDFRPARHPRLDAHASHRSFAASATVGTIMRGQVMPRLSATRLRRLARSDVQVSVTPFALRNLVYAQVCFFAFLVCAALVSDKGVRD